MFGSFLFLFIFQMLTEVPCLMNKYIFSKKINIAVWYHKLLAGVLFILNS